MNLLKKTIDYYNKHAFDYASSTVNVEFSATQDRFLTLLPKGASILDFGCGSGRDTKYFLDRGFCVDALDGSKEFCKIASQYTGIEVQQCFFEDFKATESYDGIWACSSILHLPKIILRQVMEELVQAVKDGGYIYTSFKHGEFEGERNGRYFTYFTEESFRMFLRQIAVVEITDLWVSDDVRPGRGEEKWLNLILKKMDMTFQL